ncbi:MAG TPA: hypothetical protein PLL10_08290, partial [Elusimicrobiales bacterium]|nr:hypothetical protein [Elusimicrobiales bacterium]
MKNNPHSAMILRLDHIAIKTGTPEKLFLFFTEILGLPVIWPVSKEPGFTTGGFFIGNANMETLPVEKHSSGQTAPDSAITVLTFESQPLVDLEEQLRRCGLQPTEPSQTI